MIRPDWALRSLPFYYDAIMAGVVETGIYDALIPGIFVTDLIEQAENPRVVQALIEVLCDLGWVSNWHDWLCWKGPRANVEVVAMMRQVGMWSTLSREASLKVAVGIERGGPSAPYQRRLQATMPILSTDLISKMHCVADSRWLDVGCGGGGLGLQLAQQGADVTLLDLPEVVDQLPKWLGEYSQRITVVCGDIFDYLPPEPFDGIVMLRFIETFSRDQLQRLFSRVSRFLKPDGHLVIIGYVRGISAHAALFSLNQALHQSPGQCYGLGDLRTLAERSDLHFDQVLTETSAGYVTVLLSPKLGAASGIETGGEAEGLAVDSDDVAKVY